MPKNTFFHLPQSKQQQIEQVLKQEFESNPFGETAVQHIVAKLGIARGSFYQYFESLQDSYFYILHKHLANTHQIFLQLYQNKQGDLHCALQAYGTHIAEHIFHEDVYNLYKQRYLYWNASMEQAWRAYIPKECAQNILAQQPAMSMEAFRFLSGAMHNLIQRLFVEQWNKEEFLAHYAQYTTWILEGLTYDEHHGATV
ncbi:MAG: TetR/AcrR family transcriptional regulator [Eubacteriales bacterium]|nr:TetR/AcrR family transcriptional regulator [Eubacteriales bacterium]